MCPGDGGHRGQVVARAGGRERQAQGAAGRGASGNLIDCLTFVPLSVATGRHGRAPGRRAGDAAVQRGCWAVVLK